jgi:hypothetical protein
MTTYAPLVHEPLAADALREHLVTVHGRPPHELGDLPLGAVHELEHFDVSMGLLELHHVHGAAS